MTWIPELMMHIFDEGEKSGYRVYAAREEERDCELRVVKKTDSCTREALFCCLGRTVEL